MWWASCVYSTHPGTRLVTFIKDPANHLFQAYSLTPDGGDVRYFYYNPSHRAWLDDDHVLDYGRHVPPGGGATPVARLGFDYSALRNAPNAARESGRAVARELQASAILECSQPVATIIAGKKSPQEIFG